MPELPEVENFVRDLRVAGIQNTAIYKVTVLHPNIISFPSASRFGQQLKNQKILKISRRGKYIVFHLDNGYYLLVHPRMTGQFRIFKGSVKPDAHHRLIIEFSTHRFLAYHDTRIFGRWLLTVHPEDILKKLGPEPLDRKLTSEKFAEMLKARHKQLKALLLDQHFIAGLGNIYVDESLWRAKIHPLRFSDTLGFNQAKVLLMAIQSVLGEAVRKGGTALGKGEGNYSRLYPKKSAFQYRLMVYGQTGDPCVVCGSMIQRIKAAGRSTHFCPKCQNNPTIPM